MASEPETLGFGLELLRGEIEYWKENLKRNSIPWVWSFPSTFHLGDKLSGRSHILIVEDEFLLASDLAQALESALRNTADRYRHRRIDPRGHFPPVRRFDKSIESMPLGSRRLHRDRGFLEDLRVKRWPLQHDQ